MNAHIITAAVAGILAIVFLLYYVIDIKSVPLSFIMLAVIVMVCVNLLDEVKQERKNNKP